MTAEDFAKLAVAVLPHDLHALARLAVELETLSVSPAVVPNQRKEFINATVLVKSS